MPAPGFRIDLPQGLCLGGEAVLGACAVDAPAGRITALLGPSGSGKSTLLRLAAGLLALPPAGRASPRRWRAAGGAHRLDGAAGPAGALAGRARQRDDRARICAARSRTCGRARALLAEVGLSPADAAKSPAQLSGGMRQRVALARTLMEDRPVVLMDEPFSAVDAPTRHRLQDLAARLLAGRTVLLVTHDPLEALRLADRILVLSGRPAAPAEVAVPQGTPPRTARDAALLAAQGALLERLAEAWRDAPAGRRRRAGRAVAGLRLGDGRAALPAALALARRAGAGRSRGHHRGARAAPPPAEMLAGLALGALLGCAMALTLAAWRGGRRWLLPLLLVSPGDPGLRHRAAADALARLRHGSKVAMATLIIFFPVATAFYDGLRRTEPGWLDLAATMGARPAAVLWRLRVPAALPSLASGLRVAAAVAPIGAVVGEWVGASAGLGYLMLHANGRSQTDLMFAALLVLALMALALWFATDRLLRRADPLAARQPSHGALDMIGRRAALAASLLALPALARAQAQREPLHAAARLVRQSGPRAGHRRAGSRLLRARGARCARRGTRRSQRPAAAGRGEARRRRACTTR